MREPWGHILRSGLHLDLLSWGLLLLLLQLLLVQSALFAQPDTRK